MFPPLSPRRPELPNAAGEYAPIVPPPEQSPDSPRMPPPIDYAVLDSFMKPAAEPDAAPPPAAAVPTPAPSPTATPALPRQTPPAPSEAEQDKAFDQTIGDLAAPGMHVTTPQAGPQQHDDERTPGAQAKVDDRLPEKTGKEWRILDAIFSGAARKPYDSDFWSQQDAKVDREREKDPNSPESIKARQTNAPLLKQFGFTDGEIGNLSASQLANASKGDMVGNLARLKIESAKAKAENDRRQAEYERAQRDKLEQEDRAAQRKLEDEQRAEKRKITDEERTGETADEKMRRAQVQSGLSASNAANQAALTNQLATNRDLMMGDVAEQRRVEAEQRAEERKIADEERKVATEKAKVESGYVAPDEIEASNTHIKVTNPKLLHETQATSKRQVGDIRNDIKTAERAGHMYDQMLADEADWSKGSTAAKAQVLAGLPLSEEAKRLATTKARYEAFATEMQGIKAKIAQSAGSAAEREDTKHEIPSIMSPSARQKLVGIGGMLESNANANLGATGMKVKFVASKKLVMPDGSSAADTAENRKKLDENHVKYEVQE